MDLFDGHGQRITLGPVLGRGGEGTVYEIPAVDQRLVAKVYHEAIAQEKQAKLRAMVGRADERVKHIAAWPLATIHASVNGPVRGFLMQKVTHAEPIHHLYNPGHRKQSFPNADWAFLINAARNVASTFSTIHAYDWVIGDVNPDLVLVSGKTLVRLIDCDSFQIRSGNSHFLCEVGSPHFTPPELQGLSSFKIVRTPNHDNFGLALIIFHLLMMGRHPFSGRFAGKDDMPIERAIAEFRYAFGSSSGSRGMSPPPKSLTTAILPPTIAAMFELAFTEKGAERYGRPTAASWVSVLDSLKGQLHACRQKSVHKYFDKSTSCPWCVAEKHSGIAFFIDSPVPSTLSVSVASGTNSQAISLPSSALQPTVPPPLPAQSIHKTPAKPPAPGLRAAKAWQCGAVVLSLLIFLGAAQHFHSAQAALENSNSSASQAETLHKDEPSGSASLSTSFDCNKARSRSEKLICGDADLAALDRDLAINFARAKAAAPDKQAFKATARQAWNWRNKNCTDKACLVTWYGYQQAWLLEILNSVAQDQSASASAPDTVATPPNVLTATRQATCRDVDNAYAAELANNGTNIQDAREQALQANRKCGEPGMLATWEGKPIVYLAASSELLFPNGQRATTLAKGSEPFSDQ